MCRGSVFFFQAEDGIRDLTVTGVQTCALPILTGRRIPHVSGMARVLLHCRRRTERASLWNWESSKTVRIQPSSKMGFACAETQARRARPATSLTRLSEKPNTQTIRAAIASLLKVGETARASTKTEGIA